MGVPALWLPDRLHRSCRLWDHRTKAPLRVGDPCMSSSRGRTAKRTG